jgi:hypothetical protein
MAIPKDVKINGVKPLSQDEWNIIRTACENGQGIDIELYERSHFAQREILKEIKKRVRKEKYD